MQWRTVQLITVVVRNMSAKITYILDTANELMLLMSSVILTDVMLLQSQMATQATACNEDAYDAWQHAGRN